MKASANEICTDNAYPTTIIAPKITSLDKIREVISSYCDFSNPETCYVLAMFPRKKDNPENTEHIKLKQTFRYVINTMEDAERAILECDEVAKFNSKTVFRLYLSVNRRSLTKGLRCFQHALADLQYGMLCGNTETLTTLKQLGSEWKSSLLKPESRFDKRFLFDIDFDNKTDEGKAAAKALWDTVASLTTVKYFGMSMNGFCMISEPFNIMLLTLPENVEIKKDEYLYLGCFNK